MQIIKKFENIYFSVSVKNVLFVLVFFILIMFSILTLGSVLFFEFIASIIDKLNCGAWVNEFSVVSLIIVITILFFYLAIVAFAFLLRTKNNLVSILIVLTIIVTAIFSAGIWMNPALISGSRSEQVLNIKNASFTIGTFPNNKMLSKLKDDGYDAVISLLNPSVFPFESSLLKDELFNASLTKIKIIEIHLLPWNTLEKSRIKNLLDTLINKKGKYYIHSYLDNNRINVFRKVLLELRNNLAVKPAKSRIPLDNVNNLERGEVIKLANDIYFTPYPTDDEFDKIIFPSGVRSVVALLNDKNPDDTSWINKEAKLLKQKSIQYFLKPVSIYPYDASGVFEITLFVRALSKPTIIHAVNTNSLISEAFIQTFKFEKKAFPPSLFYESMSNGKVSLVLPNVVVGPKPTVKEYQKYLFEKGVRGIIYCGSEKKILTVYDKNYFKNVGLSWEHLDVDSLSFKKEIKAGGMWYIYGADSLKIKIALLK
ncbi:MAG: hypothetical protein NTX22_13810 [Ignavibacteriales bacterium]|nr:hypothetical protein [Ignavibacteriales bacterium]